MSIGKRLRWLMKIEGSSIKDLSERCQIPYRTIQQYLSDKRKPGADHLKKIAEAGIDLHWLLLGYDEPSIKVVCPGCENITGPLAADSLLANHFFEEAFDAVDEWHQNHIHNGGAALDIKTILMGVWAVFFLYDDLLSKIEDQLIFARQHGMPVENIAQIVLTSPVKDEVRRRLKLIDPTRSEDVNGS